LILQDIFNWHALCLATLAMLKTSSPGHDIGFEPAPRFASDADIAFAEQLRRDLEERYFGRPAAFESASMRPDKDH
jgi:hypothetical protein